MIAPQAPEGKSSTQTVQRKIDFSGRPASEGPKTSLPPGQRHFFGGAPLVEFHDQKWFPRFLRDYVTDGLQFILNVGRVYRPIVPLLSKALEATNPECVIDLCSGGGGPWPWLHRALRDPGGAPISVCLTDQFPNIRAFVRLRLESHGQLTFYPMAVNAENPPANLSGFRTMFSSFHHFGPNQARAILQDAVNLRQGIGVFEAAERRPLTMIFTWLILLGGLATAPFIRPFSLTRLFWTYVIPIVPLVLFIDGVVSCLRAYSSDELASLVSELSPNDYVWLIGAQRGWLGNVIFLVGYPACGID